MIVHHGRVSTVPMKARRYCTKLKKKYKDKSYLLSCIREAALKLDTLEICFLSSRKCSEGATYRAEGLGDLIESRSVDLLWTA
jgi:hypothetical protein